MNLVIVSDPGVDDMVADQIYKIEADKVGPTVAIFAGVHGNEKAGVLALKELLPKLKPKKGTLYIVFANPPAIEKNVRLVNKNLNRCFYKGNSDSTYEDKRARELMAILDKCEALLDLHAFLDDEGEPFIVCEESALEIATKLDPAIISTNWEGAEPGATDDYMYHSGKIGICLECGSLKKSEEYKPLAIKGVLQFLKYFDMFDSDVQFSDSPKRIIETSHAVIRKSKDYYLKPGMHNFQKLKAGEVFGHQNGRDFIAEEGDLIIFPRQDPMIGAEAFIIGREETPK